MGLLTTLRLVVTDTQSEPADGQQATADSPERRARCRGCGRYYAIDTETCPHCGSGNKLRSGPPAGQTRH